METFATEILLKIFDLLEVQDLINTSKVCKRFRAIIEDYIATIPITVVNTITFSDTHHCATSLFAANSCGRTELQTKLNHWQIKRKRKRTEDPKFKFKLGGIAALKVETKLKN